MKNNSPLRTGTLLTIIAGWLMLLVPCAAAERAIHVNSTSGSDEASGTKEAPLRTLARAQSAARLAAKTMDTDVVVNLAPGVYRLKKPLEFSEADSGRNGFQVIYRSEAGPGKARILGSMPLVGWKPHGDGIWKIALPEKMLFHTLYENGRRAHKARFPNYQHQPEFPTARGPYLLTEDGNPRPPRDADRSTLKGPGWLTYRAEDAPPVTGVTKMKILIYTGGKCDWMRSLYWVESIDPAARRLVFRTRSLPFGVGRNARFFLEDELGFLDAPGEFFIDETAHTLYYKPLGEGHPDKLEIAAPVLTRLIQFQGSSRERCVEHLRLEGLALEETDGLPKGWWSTHYGQRDGALVWMNNTANVEIRQCHLCNSGRSGIMMIGHNVGNRVADCWIERMGLNGVTLCNRFAIPDGAKAIDRCEKNTVHNCRIQQIGEIHTYAACVNVFNASHNEVGHCQLADSVRYAVTLRGNTGAQYGPPVSTNHPPTKGNRLHHLRIERCGQDGGDMGALHAANLNNPDGECINTFDQVTVADSRAVPSMKDWGPDGIFLDWPKMSMHQVFRNVQIVRWAGKQLRSHRPENGESAQTENVSWKPGFRRDLMDYEQIGLTDQFPAEFGGRPPVAKPSPAPCKVTAQATAHDTTVLKWQAPKHAFLRKPVYEVYRGDDLLATVEVPRFVDNHLKERTAYSYRVAARDGDLAHLSPFSAPCEVRTPADLIPPALTGARVLEKGTRVRVAFSKPVDPATALVPAAYRFTPSLEVRKVIAQGPECVELEVGGWCAKTAYTLAVDGVVDTTPARNPTDAARTISLGASDKIVSFPMQTAGDGSLRDTSGGGGNARLHGGATVDPQAGPGGGPALVLDGQTAFAEAPNDLNLGGGDFTIMAWVYRSRSGTILSKGNGFGSTRQWSWGWGKQGVPNCISLRVNNRFFATAANSIPKEQWVHVAMVKQGTTGLSFVDAKPSGGPHDLSGLGPFVNDHPLRIGRRAYEPNPAFFQGKLAGVQLVRRALSADEIRKRRTASDQALPDGR